MFKDTAVICLDVFYWFAPDGVYVYTGGFPKKILISCPIYPIYRRPAQVLTAKGIIFY